MTHTITVIPARDPHLGTRFRAKCSCGNWSLRRLVLERSEAQAIGDGHVVLAQRRETVG